MVKHYSGMIVRQQITSKDAEIFVLEGCINFKCGNQEAENRIKAEEEAKKEVANRKKAEEEAER